MIKRFLILFFVVITQFISCSILKSETLFRETKASSMETIKNASSIQSTIRHVVLRKEDNVPAKLSKSNTVFDIRYDFDLKGIVVRIGENSVLRFKGGSLRNCIVVGDFTKIEGDLTGIFDNIHFKGTWNIPQISTNMWKSLDYPNSLQDVFALLHPEVHNKLVIESSGYEYRIVAGPEGGILNLLDNTYLIINGIIVLEPNKYEIYEMIRISSCNNVVVSGKGCISGDRFGHDYTTISGTHEFGGGIVIRASKNIDIGGITIKDITGDAICMMDNCSYIRIHDMEMKDCRRCGISIRADHNITIDNCVFSGIVNDKYNKPSAAIDIEPIVECTIRNIVIKNCRFNNNARGISSNANNYYGGSYKKGDKIVTEGRHYINFEISNCQFYNSTYTSFICPFGWENVTIKNCSFYNGRQEDIRVGYTTKCIIENCKTSCDEDNKKSKSRNFVTTFYDNKSVTVDGCSGDNIQAIFNDSKNCKISKSSFNIKR